MDVFNQSFKSIYVPARLKSALEGLNISERVTLCSII